MFKKFLYYTFIVALSISNFMCLTLFKIGEFNYIINFLIYIGVELMLVIALILKWCNRDILYKLFITIFYLMSISIVLIILLQNIGLFELLASVGGLKTYILSTDQMGVFIYILLQLLQVIFLPIPASIICIVGSLIYGPWLGSLYCCLGVLIGSYISYFIGKIFGYKVVAWIVGKDNADKYAEILRSRGGFFLSLAFLLPMFPDDILCLIAGISKMKFKSFFWITLLFRPIGVISMAFFGSGSIIPFSGWGLYVWIGILVVAVAVVYSTYRWQDEIQNFFLNKVFRKKNKRSNN